METEVIKSFLVGLGFGVDDASLAKFNKAIISATARVTALYASIKLSAAGIFYGIAKISQGFEDMGYSLRLVAPAVNKMLILRAAMLDAYRRAGMNLTQVVKQSILFNYSLAKTKFALEAVYKSVGARFLPLLTKQMDVFRSKIFQNMPKIQDALMKFVNFIFKAFDATVQLGTRMWSILGRVYDFFKSLDEATSGWSTKILLVLAAWRLLNLGFLATPLGMLIAGFTALLALWDDFKTFREGGESLINWGSNFTKILVGLIGVIGGVVAAFYAWNVASKAYVAISGLVEAVMAALDAEAITLAIAMAVIEAPIWLIVGAITALIAALTAVDAKWNVFGGHISGFFSGVGSRIMDLFGGGNSGALSAMNAQQPLLPSGSGANVKMNQETNINVHGAADASSVGRAVAGEQSKVNFDMTRNMKGAVR